MADIILKAAIKGGNNCMTCKSYCPFAEVFEDESESLTSGLCMQPGGKIDQPVVGIDYFCDKFEKGLVE